VVHLGLHGEGRSPTTLDHMSTPETADEWDLTVPVDEAELLAELRRHGLRPGQRVHMRVVHQQPVAPAAQDFRGSLAGFPESTWEDFEHASAVARRDFSVT
jgi:hypothetical protein